MNHFAKHIQIIPNFFNSDDQLLIVFLDYMFPSAIALTHTLHFYFAQLLNNPGIQEKIQEEIDRVVGRGRLPTLDDRRQ